MRSLSEIEMVHFTLVKVVTILVVGFIVLSPITNAQFPINAQAIIELRQGIRQEAVASWWGFDPEDATQILQAAINSGAPRVIIPNVGHDWNVRPITLRSNLELIFEEGVVVTAKKGEYRGRHDSVFIANGVENLVMRGYGATIRMQKEDYMSADYEKGEHRMGIRIFGSKNVQVLGLTIRDTGGDGIIVGDRADSAGRISSENIIIRDVILDNNYRQGITVGGVHNLLIENSIIKNTWGTAPQAGIDIEPGSQKSDIKLGNIVVRNTVFENNAGSAIAILPPLEMDSQISMLFENILIRGGSEGIRVGAGSRGGYNEKTFRRGHIEVRNCIIEGTRLNAIRFSSESDTLTMNVEDCVIHDAATHPPVNRDDLSLSVPIFVTGTMEVGGLSMKNVVIADKMDRPTIYGAVGIPTDDAGIIGIDGDVTIINPHGGGVLWGAPVRDVTLHVTPGDSVILNYNEIVSVPGYPLSSAQVQVEPTIHFANDRLSSISARNIVQNQLHPQIQLRHFNPDDEVRLVKILLDDELIYQEAHVPDPNSFVIDTTLLEDDTHELKVIAHTGESRVYEGRVTFTTQNFSYMTDSFEGPKEIAWFGVRYEPKTFEESTGWYYESDRPEAFFGHVNRKVRQDNTTEYLIWQTPGIREFQFELFTNNRDIQDVVTVAVSTDLNTWKEVDYETEYIETSILSGWHRLVIQGKPSPEDGAGYLRLTLYESNPPVGIQLGRASFRLLRQ